MEDTIAAIATPYGEGGIGIIRISGSDSLRILSDIFEFNGSSCEFQNRRLTYGRIIDKDENRIIDEVLAVYMKGPGTYTAEDVVEINCHGSIVSLRKTLSLVLRRERVWRSRGSLQKEPFSTEGLIFLRQRL